MWKKSYSKTYSGVQKANIWRLWTDVNQWTSWHADLDSCVMEGPFVAGNYFLMKPKGMKAIKIILTEVSEGRKFIDCTKFWGAKMYDIHEVEETKEGVKIKSTIEVTGPLAWLWVRLVAKNVADTVPLEMDALVEQARSLHGQV